MNGDAVIVPMEVEYQPAWLTWVASATTCMQALDVDCDLVDVAGMSGYAFMLSVDKGLCPSGPTMFDWGMLESGINALGRSTLVFSSSDCHYKTTACERTRAHCREAFELVKREVEAGRPCVIWGAYVPEFSVAYGVDGDSYLVKSFKECMGEEQPPVPYDELDAPGGPYVLAFPTPTSRDMAKNWGNRYAIGLAARLLRQQSTFANYGFGLAAYDVWIKALNDNNAHPFGNAYCSQCFTEGRAFAHNFLKRMVDRVPPAVMEPVSRAATAYEAAELAMIRVAKLFPFPPGKELEDEANRKSAIEALREAQVLEATAANALDDAANSDWDLKQAQANS
jgi:hypothetical protein